MKILEKPTSAIVDCPLCDCKMKIEGKDWRKVELNSKHIKMGRYGIHCPICRHFIKITPGEVKCET